MGNSEKEPHKLLKILGCIFVIPFIPLIMILSLPYGLLVRLVAKLRDNALFRRLKASKRVMDWSEVEKQLNAGVGTLIIEQTNKIGARFWWTTDNLTEVSPTPPIANFEDLGRGYITGETSDPFVSWCAVHYLSLEKGMAFLSRFQDAKLPPGPVETGFFQKLYPRAKIVQTLLLRKRD